jgi:hypothetical protein
MRKTSPEAPLIQNKLAAIRAATPQLGRITRERLQFSPMASGLPRSALTEISGPHGGGKSEMVIQFLAENPDVRAAWIEEQFSVYPVAFPQLGVGLERVLFVEAGRQGLWTTQQILRSGLFSVVVLAGKVLTEINLRRLQLAAEKAQACVILLREKPTLQGKWPISVQIEVRGRTKQLALPAMKLLKGGAA